MVEDSRFYSDVECKHPAQTRFLFIFAVAIGSNGFGFFVNYIHLNCPLFQGLSSFKSFLFLSISSCENEHGNDKGKGKLDQQIHARYDELPRSIGVGGKTAGNRAVFEEASH